jgi:hypothetical protein
LPTAVTLATYLLEITVLPLPRSLPATLIARAVTILEPSVKASTLKTKIIDQPSYKMSSSQQRRVSLPHLIAPPAFLLLSKLALDAKSVQQIDLGPVANNAEAIE